MVLLNLFDGSLIESVVDLIITAIWVIPLWFVAQNIFKYLTATTPKDKIKAGGALLTSVIIAFVFALLAFAFNIYVKPELF